jgi:hypothetical protein
MSAVSGARLSDGARHTRRLVESVEAILVDQAAIRRLIIQLADSWRPVRAVLNELHRIAVEDVVAHRPKRRRR